MAYAWCGLDSLDRPWGRRRTVYLVKDDLGRLGAAWCEADVLSTDSETVINDLMSGQYKDPIRVIALRQRTNEARQTGLGKVGIRYHQGCYVCRNVLRHRFNGACSIDVRNEGDTGRRIAPGFDCENAIVRIGAGEMSSLKSSSVRMIVRHLVEGGRKVKK